MSAFSDLLGGDGNDADFINEYGDNYVYNQTGFDAADNGAATKSGTSASYTKPIWMQSLGSLFGSAAEVASAVIPIISGSTTQPQSGVAAPKAGSTTTTSTSKSTSILLWLLGGVAAVVALVLLLRK